MGRILQRNVLPSLLLIAAGASIVYGMRYHAAAVIEEQEVEVSILVPLPFAPGPQMGDLALGQPFRMGQMADQPPAFMKRTVKRIAREIRLDLEPSLTRDVTIGGLARLKSGEIRRTYHGRPPSLCPT